MLGNHQRQSTGVLSSAPITDVMVRVLAKLPEDDQDTTLCTQVTSANPSEIEVRTPDTFGGARWHDIANFPTVKHFRRQISKP